MCSDFSIYLYTDVFQVTLPKFYQFFSNQRGPRAKLFHKAGLKQEIIANRERRRHIPDRMVYEIWHVECFSFLLKKWFQRLSIESYLSAKIGQTVLLHLLTIDGVDIELLRMHSFIFKRPAVLWLRPLLSLTFFQS